MPIRCGKKFVTATGVKCRTCFWCERVARLTNDHVVPKGVNGPHHHTNLVLACSRCQHERGRFVCLFIEARALREMALSPAAGSKTFRKRVRRQRRNQEELAPLLAQWTERETALWGSSPTAALDYTLPIIEPEVPSGQEEQ